MARHMTAGELLYQIRQSTLPPGKAERNTYWEDLSESVQQCYNREAKRIATAYNREHPAKTPKPTG